MSTSEILDLMVHNPGPVFTAAFLLVSALLVTTWNAIGVANRRREVVTLKQEVDAWLERLERLTAQREDDERFEQAVRLAAFQSRHRRLVSRAKAQRRLGLPLLMMSERSRCTGTSSCKR